MTTAALREQVGELLGRPVTDEEDLLAAGLDSIRLMVLAERWESEGADVSFVTLLENPTVAAWARLVGN
ncbi:MULTISPECIES: phosphopantetheine-binding protein [Crossiella]|uniref:Bifunctional isochorismate lyase/aryl carrier protein n=1 Tax=Crossiella cryophila TaxID=43355 RepID=A0A7W7CFI7_9PSEU|nr:MULTISPECIES: phosphopantetheine-binding protein [Crossiella]MBB4680027.1 bifunctional isochorismate lyase/aryl carrier protein [Crossiella cryophila]MCK2244103.1 phosphopantetheine-binding protein [Crossiella sp. S99.2]MCK2257907.1 phosphopantetheine-binding protein [Crossiella sp. S99.1]